MERFAKFFTSIAAASLLTACGGGLQSVPTTGSQASALPAIQSHLIRLDNGGIAAIMWSREYTGSTFTNPVAPAHAVPLARAASTNNLTWHGGPVQTTPKIYIVFWGSKWSTSNSVYKTLTGFMGAIGGGKWINSDTQYSGSNGKITNPTSQLAGSWIDATSVPRRPSSSNVGAEAERAVQHFGYGGVNANYIVAIQSGNDPSGFKSQWCAWHSSESESQGVVSYTDLPYQPDAGYSCGAGSVNNPGTNDGVSIVSGHEEAETQTDPQPDSGWLDASGAENGDKCAWQNLENNPAAGGYPTQPLWSNATSSCVQSY